LTYLALLDTEVVYPSKTVTYPSTNWAKHKSNYIHATNDAAAMAKPPTKVSEWMCVLTHLVLSLISAVKQIVVIVKLCYYYWNIIFFEQLQSCSKVCSHSVWQVFNDVLKSILLHTSMQQFVMHFHHLFAQYDNN